MYPLHDGFHVDEDIVFTSDDGIQVRIVFVQCEDIEQSLISFIQTFLS